MTRPSGCSSHTSNEEEREYRRASVKSGTGSVIVTALFIPLAAFILRIINVFIPFSLQLRYIHIHSEFQNFEKCALFSLGNTFRRLYCFLVTFLFSRLEFIVIHVFSSVLNSVCFGSNFFDKKVFFQSRCPSLQYPYLDVINELDDR